MKRGQQTLSLPFGLLFSIFLIVVFIAVAFIAVGSFLDIGSASKIGKFYTGLQESVDSAWRSQSVEKDFEINLPSGIERVCFADVSGEITNFDDYDLIERYFIYEGNLFLVPPEEAEDLEWKNIEHLNISRITEQQNPYCVDAGRSLNITKGFYEKTVTIQ